MKRLDLRLRITVAISVVCISIVAALGGLLYMASERMELALVEQLVAEELDFLVRRHEADPEYVPDPGPNVEYYAFRPDETSPDLPRFLQDLGNGHYEIDIGEGRGERDVVIRQVGDMRFVVVYNIGPYEQREQEFKRLILIALFVVMGLAVVLGYLLSGFLTRQLTLLAQKVSTLQPNHPYDSLLRDEQDREVATLALALDKYHQLFLTMIKREQEFTANISHELRTPLTAIGTSCELLQADSSLSEKGRVRVHNIMQAAKAMTEHARALLLLARQHEIKEREKFTAHEFLNDVVVTFRDEMDRKGLIYETQVPPNASLNTNRAALQLVLCNLLSNAVTYTASGFVQVSLMDGKLLVSDSGPGIPEDKLPLIIERSYRGQNETGGLGLGLDIVRRICEQLGWTMEVQSVVGEGSTFTIDLGADVLSYSS